MAPPALLLLTCLLLAFNPTDAQKAPRFKACKRSQPAAKLNECVRDSLQKAVPELVKGLPNFGLETIDPLRIDNLEVPPNKKSSAVNIDLNLKNLDIIGLKNAKIKSANMDVDKMKLSVKIDIEGNVMLQGDYKINGKVLVLPIVGSGPCNVTLVNVKGEITEILAKPTNKEGKMFAQVTSLKFIISSASRVYFQLDNLFNGNKELGENMNLVLNDNWNEILQDLRGPVEVALGGALRAIVGKVLKSVPYNDIFPL